MPHKICSWIPLKNIRTALSLLRYTRFSAVTVFLLHSVALSFGSFLFILYHFSIHMYSILYLLLSEPRVFAPLFCSFLGESLELVRQFQRTKPYHDKYKSLSWRKQKEYAKNNAPVLYEYGSIGSRLKSLYPDGRFPSETLLDRQSKHCMRSVKNSTRGTTTSKKSIQILTRQAERFTIILQVCVMILNTEEKRASWNSTTNWKLSLSLSII